MSSDIVFSCTICDHGDGLGMTVDGGQDLEDWQRIQVVLNIAHALASQAGAHHGHLLTAALARSARTPAERGRLLAALALYWQPLSPEDAEALLLGAVNQLPHHRHGGGDAA